MKITCREVVEVLISYDDESLEIEVREQVDSHFSCCPNCVSYLRSYRATIRLTKCLTCDALPDDLVQRMRKAIRDAEGTA